MCPFIPLVLGNPMAHTNNVTHTESTWWLLFGRKFKTLVSLISLFSSLSVTTNKSLEHLGSLGLGGRCTAKDKKSQGSCDHCTGPNPSR